MKKPHEITIPEIDESAPLALFNGDRLKLEIDKLELEISSLVLDPTNPAEHKHYGSIGLKIGKFFAAIDRAGKSLVDPLKQEAKKVDAQRSIAKSRGAELKADFLFPRTQYDAEVAAHAKAITDALELMQNGHHRVGEFRTTTLAEWDAHLAAINAVELSESFFGDRLADARELQGTAIEMNTARRAKFIEDQAALEAGRAALKVQQDAEAAKRHAARVQEKEAKDKLKVKPEPAVAAPVSMSKMADSPMTAAKNLVYGQLVNYGMTKEQAVKLINAIQSGQIKHLQIVA